MAKHDLTFTPPVMNAAGSLGFSPDRYRKFDWTRLGAFVTNPISNLPRTPSHGERFAMYPGGFLLHTGYPNPGLRRILRRRYSELWGRSPVPVIVHLLGQNMETVAEMTKRLENVEGVMGLEVGISSEATIEMVIALCQAASGELPVIARLPMERANELSSAAIQAGASAISLAPPRGILPAPDGESMEGRLYGPAVFPLAMRIVKELAQRGIPTIGAGGIYSQENVEAMLSLGAMAVQIDSWLWRNPAFMT